MSLSAKRSALVRRLLHAMPAPLLRLLPGRALRAKAVWFAAVGAVNAAVDFAVFAAAHLALDVNLVAANVMAWAVAVSGSYLLNARFTFAAETGRALRLRDYLAFAASQVAGLVVNTATVLLASQLVPVLAAKLLAIIASFAVNFALSHLLVFRGGTRRD